MSYTPASARYSCLTILSAHYTCSCSHSHDSSDGTVEFHVLYGVGIHVKLHHFTTENYVIGCSVQCAIGIRNCETTASTTLCRIAYVFTHILLLLLLPILPILYLYFSMYMYYAQLFVTARLVPISVYSCFRVFSSALCTL